MHWLGQHYQFETRNTMRSPSDDLFRLVKALNKGEKRNFKLLAGLMAGDKKYIELFDLIDKQVTYDETKLSKSDLYGGQLSVAKNYLFRFLLKSLLYYNSDPISEMIQLKEQARILTSRDLLSQAQKALRKALQIADKLEAFESIHEMLDRQMELALRKLETKNISQKMLEIHAFKAATLKKMENLNAYLVLHGRLALLLNSKSRALQLEEPSELTRVKAHPLLKSAETAQSIRAKIEFFTIKRKLASYNGEWERALGFCKQAVQLYESNPPLMKINVRGYFSEVSHLVACYSGMGRHKEADQSLSNFKRLEKEHPQARSEFFQIYFVLELGLAIHLGKPQRGLELVPRIKKVLKKSRDRMPLSRVLLLHYLPAYLHFMVGNLSEALNSLNAFLAEPKTDSHINFQALARLLRLLVFFEMRDYAVLESELGNVQRFLAKHLPQYPYAEYILRAMRKLLKGVGAAPMEALLTETLEEFLKKVDRGIVLKGTDMLDFQLWLRSKLAKQSMAKMKELEREKEEGGWK